VNQNETCTNSFLTAKNAIGTKQNLLKGHDTEINLNENDLHDQAGMAEEITKSNQNLCCSENIKVEAITKYKNIFEKSTENDCVGLDDFNQIDLNTSIIANGTCSNGDLFFPTVTSEPTKEENPNASIDNLKKHTIVEQITDSSQAINFIENLNDSNNDSKPFFASKLTNSQLSEELSNEIGL
jgi:hypothetical protein